MNFEHVALNVKDPVAVAAWYGAHLDLKTIVKKNDAAQTHFLTDGNGMQLEIYCNPADQVPDYATMDPLILHLAFVSENPTADKEALLTAGATLVAELQFDDGTHLVMMRDPWGLAIQLCKRG